MKLAFFIGALNRGGAETLILDICRKHKEMPFDFVCIFRHEGNMSEAFKASGAPLMKIDRRGSLFSYILQVRRVLLREKITIVHSQTPSNTLILAVALLGTGIKIMTTFHGHLFADAPWWQRTIVYAASETIICVSEYQKRYYEKKWRLPKENKLRVVYNGIDFAKFDVEKPIVESKKRKEECGGIRLCMVGNFVKGRTPLVIVKAIGLLSLHGIKDFDFYFIGRKNEKEPWRFDECVDYCNNHKLTNVSFLGTREDVPLLLRTMDGFVYSTEHDTFGIAVVEAIAAGLPIVVNDWSVMAEVCDLGLPKSSTAIHFYKTDDVMDCAKQIECLINNLQNHRESLKKDTQQAAKVAIQKYSIQTHIENLSSIYSQL